MPKRSEMRSNAGFSLVEVLCAVAIAASAIAALTNGIGGSLKGAAALDNRLGARIVLQSILEDELAAGNTAPDRREGDSGPYRWRLDITPEITSAKLTPPFRMYRLTASVNWGKGASVSATTLKLAQ